MGSSGELVTFNVGGELFTVRQSLLDEFPSTVLARSASKEWNSDNTKDKKPTFIDRDGKTFHCVLKYMRDSKVNLLPHESKQAVLDELSYFGFENVSSECVTYDSYAAIGCSLGYKAMISHGEKSVRDARHLVKCEQHALETYKSFTEKNQTSWHCDDWGFWVYLENNKTNLEVFSACLAKYGLQFRTVPKRANNTEFSFSIKPIN